MWLFNMAVALAAVYLLWVVAAFDTWSRTYEKEMTMPEGCKPIIKPCNHGRFKLSCACGWKVHPRLLTVAAAEKMWANHANATR